MDDIKIEQGVGLEQGVVNEEIFYRHRYHEPFGRVDHDGANDHNERGPDADSAKKQRSPGHD
ncbi:MAG TPA: hypothetical protein VFC44_10545 [Candidatus Saccharimonadales bacterium]|nr:hypothetical protein [Candidatus Saccharimonadales bacterium]